MSKELDLLKQANSEIKSLRKRNEIMSARLNMFDNVMLLLGTNFNERGQGMSPDLCFEIDKFVEEQEKLNIPK